MKNNRKNRKLNFIRSKNNIRLGKVKFYFYEKISLEDYEETTTNEYWHSLIELAKQTLFDKYKLRVRNEHIQANICMDDDYVKELSTNVVVLFN